MNMRQYRNIVPLIIVFSFLLAFTGCVETPPQQGDYEPGIDLIPDSLTGISGGVTDSSGSGEEGGADGSSGSESSEDALPVPVVEVTPNPHSNVQSHTPLYQNLYTQEVITPHTVLIPVYTTGEKEYLNSGMAFLYTVTTPPVYVVLSFKPKMDTITKVFDKRTGDKEGTVSLDITRPSPYSWMEMTIYDTETGNPVAIEGYGKIYTEDLEKTVILRESGTYQFDFWGSFINSTITLKIPLEKATEEQYQAALRAESKDSGKLGFVYLILPDLPGGWSQTGDSEHTATLYKSTLTHPASGSRFNQIIQKFSSESDAEKGYNTLKDEIGHLTIRTLSIGEDGISYESVRKNGILYKKGLMVVQLDSYSYPPVPISELKRYAEIIEGRIESEQ